MVIEQSKDIQQLRDFISIFLVMWEKKKSELASKEIFESGRKGGKD